MLINRKLINRKITLINRDLKNLEEIGKVPLAKYLRNDTYEALAERYLERIIGRMIDINYHILTEEASEPPLDYFDSFVKLGARKYLPREFAEKIANSAGLRNRLAHEYDEIDPKKIHSAVKTCLADAPKYLNNIIKILDKLSGQRKFDV